MLRVHLGAFRCCDDEIRCINRPEAALGGSHQPVVVID